MSETRREDAIRRLSRSPAVANSLEDHRDLTGAPATAAGSLYLLRAFATTNSSVRLLHIDGDVIVESNGLGGLHGLRRYPCVALLDRPPGRVYTYATYDM